MELIRKICHSGSRTSAANLGQRTCACKSKPTWILLAFNNYGLSEVIGPGVSGECYVRDGMHIQEDHFLVECIDPETLEPVQEGERGELVFTAMTQRGHADPSLSDTRHRLSRLHSLSVRKNGSEDEPRGRSNGRHGSSFVVSTSSLLRSRRRCCGSKGRPLTI